MADEALKGLYSNNTMINYTREEFTLDFLNVVPPQGILSARIIVSPGQAKKVAMALIGNIKKYEQRFGEIREGERPKQTKGFGVGMN